MVAADDDQGPAASDEGGIRATGDTPAAGYTLETGYTPVTKTEPLDLGDVFMTVFLPNPQAGRLGLGDEARIVLDAAPE